MFEHVHALGLLACGHGGMEFVKAGGQGGLGKNLRVHGVFLLRGYVQYG